MSQTNFAMPLEVGFWNGLGSESGNCDLVKYFEIILLKLRLRGNVEISFRSELSDLFSVANYENKQTVRIGEARCRTTFFFFLCFQVA